MAEETSLKDVLARLEAQERRIKMLESLVHNSKEVLNLEEASQYLGVSRSMLYKMTHNEVLPFYRPNGKLIFFEKAELLKWLRQNRSMSDAEANQAAIKHMDSLCK